MDCKMARSCCFCFHCLLRRNFKFILTKVEKKTKVTNKPAPSGSNPHVIGCKFMEFGASNSPTGFHKLVKTCGRGDHAFPMPPRFC